MAKFNTVQVNIQIRFGDTLMTVRYMFALSLTTGLMSGVLSADSFAQQKPDVGFEISVSGGWFVPGQPLQKPGLDVEEIVMTPSPTTAGHLILQFSKLALALRGLYIEEIIVENSLGEKIGTARLEALSVALGFSPKGIWPRSSVRPILWLALGAERIRPIDSGSLPESLFLSDFQLLVDGAVGLDFRVTENLRFSLEGRALMLPAIRNQGVNVQSGYRSTDSRVDLAGLVGITILLP